MPVSPHHFRTGARRGLIRRGEAANVRCPLLRLAYTHLKAYEARRAA